MLVFFSPPLMIRYFTEQNHSQQAKTLQVVSYYPPEIVHIRQELDHGDLVAPPVRVAHCPATVHLHGCSCVLRVGKTANPGTQKLRQFFSFSIVIKCVVILDAKFSICVYNSYVCLTSMFPPSSWLETLAKR